MKNLFSKLNTAARKGIQHIYFTPVEVDRGSCPVMAFFLFFFFLFSCLIVFYGDMLRIIVKT